jgi:hypothetical protein
MIADDVLLDHNKCYTDGLVDLFFAETAAKQGTQRVSVLLAQKLSGVNSGPCARYMRGSSEDEVGMRPGAMSLTNYSITESHSSSTTRSGSFKAPSPYHRARRKVLLVVPWHQMIFITVLLSTFAQNIFFMLIYCVIKRTSPWSSASSLPGLSSLQRENSGNR